MTFAEALAPQSIKLANSKAEGYDMVVFTQQVFPGVFVVSVSVLGAAWLLGKLSGLT
jgi:hypothetical protein